MRICMILEGCYPYVTGGVSSWMHQYIQAMPEHEFVLLTIGASSKDRGRFKYTLPENVTAIEEIFLDEALKLYALYEMEMDVEKGRMDELERRN